MAPNWGRSLPHLLQLLFSSPLKDFYASHKTNHLRCLLYFLILRSHRYHCMVAVDLVREHRELATTSSDIPTLASRPGRSIENLVQPLTSQNQSQHNQYGNIETLAVHQHLFTLKTNTVDVHRPSSWHTREFAVRCTAVQGPFWDNKKYKNVCLYVLAGTHGE